MSEESVGIARCLRCGYILVGLEEHRCPECGQTFDPENPFTFTDKPLFVRWKFWLPLVLAMFCAGGILMLLVLGNTPAVGWSLTIFLPFVVGSILGYSTRMARMGSALRVIGLITLIAAMVMGLFMSIFALSLVGGLAGMFCAVVLVLIVAGPVLLGVFCGVMLRWTMKRTRFSQRAHLPILILLMLSPFAVALAEHFVRYKFVARSVETSMVMPVDVETAWNSVMFYEQVKHDPPLLLKLGLSRPLYSYGSMAKVGDIKTCVYDHGKLVKKITKIEPGKAIEFVVIKQEIETCGCVLKGGSFRVESLRAGQTRVTLLTEYEPILAPRFAWQPWEDASVHALHNHVLAGMMDKAQEDLAQGNQMR